MAQGGWSDKIRSIALARYVEPAIRCGKKEFSIGVKEMRDILIPMGFSAANTPQVCSAIQSDRFLHSGEKRLEIVAVDGPPSKQSTTVVVHYRVSGSGPAESDAHIRAREDSQARALRVAQDIRGLLKDELAQYGGGDAFLKWIRSEDGSRA